MIICWIQLLNDLQGTFGVNKSKCIRKYFEEVMKINLNKNIEIKNAQVGKYFLQQGNGKLVNCYKTKCMRKNIPGKDNETEWVTIN